MTRGMSWVPLFSGSPWDLGTRLPFLQLTSIQLLWRVLGVGRLSLMESIEITHSLPIIHGGKDRILWRIKGDTFSSAAVYDIFHPPGPKVGWSSLLLGGFKIPRHRFILWLAILGKLSTLDKPWLHHLGTNCALCQTATPETHEHLFFGCPFASDCLREIRRLIRFHWPYSSWGTAVQWASRRWRGKHVVNASLRA